MLHALRRGENFVKDLWGGWEQRRQEQTEAKEKKGKTSCQFWTRAELQWRDTHPRGEDIFEVLLHQSTPPFILIFNLSLSPTVIISSVYRSPSVNEEGDWHTDRRFCLPGATSKLHTWAWSFRYPTCKNERLWLLFYILILKCFSNVVKVSLASASIVFLLFLLLFFLNVLLLFLHLGFWVKCHVNVDMLKENAIPTWTVGGGIEL